MVKVWRALEGKPKEVFFAQVYSPGELSELDFTWMNELGICLAVSPSITLCITSCCPTPTGRRAAYVSPSASKVGAGGCRM